MSEYVSHTVSSKTSPGEEISDIFP